MKKIEKRIVALLVLLSMFIFVLLPIFTWIGESFSNEITTTPVQTLITTAAPTIQTSSPTPNPSPTLTLQPTSKPTPQISIISTNWGEFKSYMSYKTITNRDTFEYQIAHVFSYTDSETGIRIVRDSKRTYYCIAIGTGWGYKVGDKLLVTLDTGNTFYAIMTDTKKDSHTKSDNKTTISDGSVIEFVVGSQKEIKNFSWYSKGTLSVSPMFKGGVKSIDKI